MTPFREPVSLFDGLVDEPALRQQDTALPPRPLVVEGVPRHPGRQVTVDQALAFSARGMRRFLLTFDLSCELSEEEFRRIVTAERHLLDDDKSYEGMEAELLVYGRRKGDTDTRLVGVVLARFTRET